MHLAFRHKHEGNACKAFREYIKVYFIIEPASLPALTPELQNLSLKLLLSFLYATFELGSERDLENEGDLHQLYLFLRLKLVDDMKKTLGKSSEVAKFETKCLQEDLPKLLLWGVVNEDKVGKILDGLLLKAGIGKEQRRRALASMKS